MDPLVSGIIVGVSTTMIASMLYAIARRFSVKTKSDAAIEQIKLKMEELSEGQKLIFKLLLPLLIKARDGKTNGELKEAIDIYNTYMQNK